MPRKHRFAKTRRSDSSAAELTPAVVYILLSGWGAKPPEGRDESETDGLFALMGGWGFAAPRDDDAPLPVRMHRTDAPVARLWLRHEAFLRAEAQRLGILPSYRVKGGSVFFGESCLAPYTDRDPDYFDSSAVRQ